MRDEPDEDLIAEAITEAFGERCPDFEPGCHCCRVWARYDVLMELATGNTVDAALASPQVQERT